MNRLLIYLKWRLPVLFVFFAFRVIFKFAPKCSFPPRPPKGRVGKQHGQI